LFIEITPLALMTCGYLAYF